MRRKAGAGHAGIVLAAGSGTRIGHGHSKVYLPLAGRPMLAWSMELLLRVGGVERLLLVARAADLELAAEVLERELPGVPVELLSGGRSRHESEYRALAHLAGDIRAGLVTAVLIHDAARPLASVAMTEQVLAAALRRGAAVPGVPVENVLRVDLRGRLAPTGSERLVTIQTPQAFLARPLLQAHEAAARDGFTGTDTAACVERYTETEVAVVPGDPGNLKITFPDDLLVAERLLARCGRHPDRALRHAAHPGEGLHLLQTGLDHRGME
ncbi:MAG TPA: IspD/TarI family cytidylyltransferase [Actinomycetes bacterium]|jgi:2-C-methyl-D-erythritol 4-phosphate cytidylyltransferase|nr:IspD/TarI family cytidylyltransferase [Actinomycetes bacterium]